MKLVDCFAVALIAALLVMTTTTTTRVAAQTTTIITGNYHLTLQFVLGFDVGANITEVAIATRLVNDGVRFRAFTEGFRVDMSAHAARFGGAAIVGSSNLLLSSSRYLQARVDFANFATRERMSAMYNDLQRAVMSRAIACNESVLPVSCAVAAEVVAELAGAMGLPRVPATRVFVLTASSYAPDPPQPERPPRLCFLDEGQCGLSYFLITVVCLIVFACFLLMCKVAFNVIGGEQAYNPPTEDDDPSYYVTPSAPAAAHLNGSLKLEIQNAAASTKKAQERAQKAEEKAEKRKQKQQYDAAAADFASRTSPAQSPTKQHKDASPAATQNDGAFSPAAAATPDASRISIVKDDDDAGGTEMRSPPPVYGGGADADDTFASPFAGGAGGSTASQDLVDALLGMPAASGGGRKPMKKKNDDDDQAPVRNPFAAMM